MGILKKIKKVVKKVGRTVLPMVSMGMYKGKGGKEESLPEEGQRSEAAKRLAETQKQAGGGQIKYNTEETVT